MVQPSTENWQEMEEALRRSERLAFAGLFAASIMHEINGPLEAAVNLNYLILQSVGDPESVRMYGHMMEEQFRTLSRLSHQTLSFYRTPESKETIAIVALAEAALRIHRQKIADKKIRLLKTLPGDLSVEAHPGDILQVLSNLISNAVEALPERGILRLRARRLGRAAHIVVADNGPGIPDDISRKIFDPFFTTKNQRGTGLGLAITKGIVEKHLGSIRKRTSIRSGRNGTTFLVSLPLAPEPAA